MKFITRKYWKRFENIDIPFDFGLRKNNSVCIIHTSVFQIGYAYSSGGQNVL